MNRMHKLALLAFVLQEETVTSPVVAEAFDISLQAASAYLSKNHARGYLWRHRVGPGFVYGLSMAGARNLAYWVARVGEAAEAEMYAPPAPDLVTLWCGPCRRATRVPRDQAGMTLCRCGREYTELEE